jgi:hypothetical protein
VLQEATATTQMRSWKSQAEKAQQQEQELVESRRMEVKVGLPSNTTTCIPLRSCGTGCATPVVACAHSRGWLQAAAPLLALRSAFRCFTAVVPGWGFLQCGCLEALVQSPVAARQHWRQRSGSGCIDGVLVGSI